MKKTINDTEIEKLLWHKPVPVYYKPLNLTFFYAAKSGSELGLKWFFYQINFLDAVTFYHPWVHNFVSQIFLKSYKYEENIKEVLDSNCVVLVRNPFTRAVSSYIMAIKHEYINKLISKFLGRLVDREHTFSFREYINYLESGDLSSSDLHHRIQAHPLIRHNLLPSLHIVKLENIYQDFRNVEIQLNLKECPLKKMGNQSNYRRSIKQDKIFDSFCFDTCFKKQDKYPAYEKFYSTDLVDKIIKLYSPDFELFKYEQNPPFELIYDSKMIFDQYQKIERPKNEIQNTKVNCSEFQQKFNIIIVNKIVNNNLVKCALDFPKSNSTIDSSVDIIKIKGWVISKNQEVIHVEIVDNNRIINTAQVNQLRPDVAKVYPQYTQAKTSGFDVRVRQEDLMNKEVTVRVLLDNNTRFNLYSIKYTEEKNNSMKIENTVELNTKLPTNTLLFLHIPKTAGTSFRCEIEKKLKCVFEYGANPITSDFVHTTIDKGDFSAFLQEFKSQGFEAVYGHFSISKYLPIIDENTRICTFLRHPVQRTISNYQHFCRYYGYNKSIREFLSNPQFHNQQYKLLSGIDIKDFYFLGITEDYKNSIKIFNQLTNLNVSDIVINNNPEKPIHENYKLDSDLIKFIENKNEQDLELYERAKLIFATKLQELKS